MKFKEYLKQKLSEEDTPHYNPNGNSIKAIASRGMFNQIIYKYKEYPKLFKTFLKDFDGFNTPIYWFFMLPFMVIASPVIPFVAGIVTYRNSINWYYSKYVESYLNK